MFPRILRPAASIASSGPVRRPSHAATPRCLPPSPVKPLIRLAAPHPRDAPPWRKELSVRNNLFVGNLPCAEGHELEQLLSRFGTVRFAAVVAGGGVGRGGRFGVVGMESDAEARAAIRVLDGFEVRGCRLTVRWATAAEQTACGHPTMFGSMNMADRDGRETPAT